MRPVPPIVDSAAGYWPGRKRHVVVALQAHLKRARQDLHERAGPQRTLEQPELGETADEDLVLGSDMRRNSHWRQGSAVGCDLRRCWAAGVCAAGAPLPVSRHTA
jgi:hypothetical protein